MTFNSQICTTREQSERLLSLGLKKETADMCYKVTTHDFKGNEINEKDRHYTLCCWYDESSLVCGFERRETIPAWSLHRLLCFLPKHIQVYDEVWKFKRNLYLSIDEDFNIRYEENIDEPCFDKIFWTYDIYQNCIDCIEWLIKEGYFPKEYLEE